MEETLESPIQQTDVPKLSVNDFALKIKSKYPQYKDINNAELVSKITSKYPQYNSQINFTTEKKSPVQSNSSSVGTSILPSLQNGGITDQSSPVNTPYSGITTNPAMQQQLVAQGQQGINDMTGFRPVTTVKGAKTDYSGYVGMPTQISKPVENAPVIVPTDRSKIKNPRLLTPEEDKADFGTEMKPVDTGLAPIESHADTWGNIGSFLPHTVLSGLQKDAGQALQFIGGKIGEVRDEQAIKHPSNILNGNTEDYGITGALTQLGLHLENAGKQNQAQAEENNLPNTTMGNVTKLAAGFIPDLIELAATPELDIAKVGKLGEALTKYGGKYAPKAAEMVAGKFPILMGTKGLTSGYTEGKDQGMSDYDATSNALVKSAEEYGKGLLFEGAGAIAGKASNIGIKALEDAGWMKGGKIVEGAQKAILHSTAQATAFGAVPFITNAAEGKDTSLDDFKQNAIFGGMMGLFHGNGKEESPDKPTAADGSAAQVMARSPLIDLHNFMQSDMDAIKSAHDIEANPADLHIKAAIHANDAYYATDPQARQENIVQSSLNAKLASVKSFTNAILENKDAVIKGVEQLPDIEYADKQTIIDKINQVHKEFDPIEQQKTDLSNQIDEVQNSPKGDIIGEKEKAVKLKDLNKQLDEIVTNQYDQQKDRSSGKRVTYSKGTADDEGKYFKTIDGEKEEITKSRYELEKPPKINEQTSENTDVTPKVNETPEPPATGTTETPVAPINEAPEDNKVIKHGNEQVVKRAITLAVRIREAAAKGDTDTVLANSKEYGNLTIGLSKEEQLYIKDNSKNNLTTNPDKNESSTNDEKNGREENGQGGGKDVSSESPQQKEVKATIPESEAPTLKDVTRNIDETGKPGLNIEDGKTSAGTAELPREQTPVEGYKYVTNRDENGKVNGALEVSYYNKEGLQKEPQSAKIVVDENSRRRGIGTSLLNFAKDNGIDVKNIKDNAFTEDGKALFDANKKGGNTDAIQEQGTGEVGIRNEATVREGVGKQDKSVEPAGDSNPQNSGSADAQSKEEVSNKEPIGITREETKKQREIRGLEDLPESQRVTLNEMFDNGKKAVENNEIDPTQLAIDIADKPRNLSNTEVNALLYDRQNIREQLEDLRNRIDKKIARGDSVPETTEVVQSRQRFLEDQLDTNERAIRAGARENSLALNAMKNMINSDYTLATQRARMRAAAGGELTTAMEAELEQYKTERDEALKRLEDYENEKQHKELTKEIQRQTRAKTKSVTKESLKAERQSIVEDFRAELKKMRQSGEFNSAGKATAQFIQAAAPFMRKMLTNLIKEGIVEAKDIVAAIRDEFKDDIDGLTDRDIMDALSGKYNKKVETKNELVEQRQTVSRILNLTTRLEDLRNRKTLEKSEAKQVQKNKEIERLGEEIKAEKKKISFETAEDRSKESLRNKLDKINERIKNQDFSKEQNRPDIKPDAEHITLQAKVKKAENNFDAMAERLHMHQQTKLDKTLTTIQQIRRAILLSGTKTLAKLYSFATARSITTPIEEAVTSLNTKIPGLRKVAERSPRFNTGFNAKAEAQAISTRWSKATLGDSWKDVLSSGVGELDRLYGKNGVDKDFDLNPSALEFFGRLHGAFKNSTKRAEFFRSFQKRLEYAAKEGKDINDPNIQFATGLEAYADGKRSILMNDNLLVDKGYKSLLRGLEQSSKGNKNNAGKVMAAVIRGLFPIVKIPTNYVLESLDVATFGVRAIPNLVKAMTKGADSLSPKEADMIMRTLAKGQVGLALMIYAYHNPQIFGGYYNGQRNDKELGSGEIKMFGHILPHFLSHNPYFEAMQIAATMRRAVDKANRTHKNSGVVEGSKEALKGLTEQIPFNGLSEVFGSKDKKETAGDVAGKGLRNLTEPRLIQEAAEAIDAKTDDKHKRAPRGFVQQLETGIPGLREDVPLKKKKKY